MELGLFIEPQCGGSYDRLLELALWAENKGLDAFARSDHYLNQEESAQASDALVSFGGLARDTNRIRLVSLVSPITFRHPAVMAKSATTIDEMSGGRFSLGVGSGWMQAEHDAFDLDLPPMKERFDRLEEALEVITTIVAGGGKVTGTHYSLDAEKVLPKGSAGLGIVVGGGGMNKTPRLAGTYATEYNMFVTERDTFDQRMEGMRRAAEQARRNPDDILISFAGPAFVYETDDEHREALTTRGAKRDMSPDDYATFLDARSVPHGTAESAGRAIEQMASWGVGRYYVQDYVPLDDVDLTAMDRIFSALRV